MKTTNHIPTVNSVTKHTRKGLLAVIAGLLPGICSKLDIAPDADGNLSIDPDRIDWKLCVLAGNDYLKRVTLLKNGSLAFITETSARETDHHVLTTSDLLTLAKGFEDAAENFGLLEDQKAERRARKPRRTSWKSFVRSFPALLKDDGSHVCFSTDPYDPEAATRIAAKMNIAGTRHWLITDRAEDSTAFVMQCAESTEGYIEDLKQFLSESWCVDWDDPVFIAED